MRDTAQSRSPSRESGSRYPVRVLEGPELDPGGLRHLEPGGPGLLVWDRVRLAIAAEIGEPEGVRTIVFDLIAEAEPDCGFLAHRLDVEPGAEAMHFARELAGRLPAEACGPSIKSLATDGIPSRWYPDLDAFEEDAIALLPADG